MTDRTANVLVDDTRRPLASDEEDRVSPKLDSHDEEHVRESVGLHAAGVYEVVRLEGQRELNRPLLSLFWSGVGAGISIGFSFLAEAIIAANLPDAGWAPLVENLGYSVGFLIVILGHQQLFTENTLTAVLPAMANPSRKWLIGIVNLWCVVLVANVIGCFIFAVGVAYAPVTNGATDAALAAIVSHLMEFTASEMFFRGIVAGWIIAALVWMLPSCEGSEAFVIILMTYLIALGDFTHIIAGSAEVIYGMLVMDVTLTSAVFQFFIPTLAGNVVGGTVLFALLAYAQVRREIGSPNTDWKTRDA